MKNLINFIGWEITKYVSSENLIYYPHRQPSKIQYLIKEHLNRMQISSITNSFASSELEKTILEVGYGINYSAACCFMNSIFFECYKARSIH